MRQVIITADDFGLAVPVNEAVARARRLPTLRVGLHVVVVDGRPAMAPAAIPGLVDATGRLRSELLRTSLRIFFLPSVRRQLRAEVRAQFEAFRATGLPLDHVNTHHHMHLHPTVLSAILELAPEFGVRAVRLPREPLSAARRQSLRQRLLTVARSAFHAPWLALMRWRLRRAGICCNEYVLGLSDDGAMGESTVVRLVDALPEGVTEFYFHPATSSAWRAPLPRPADRHVAELRALCSARVRAALDVAGAVRTSFGELR